MVRKREQGPRPWEIGVAAGLSVLLGTLGAAVFLALQPPEEVSEMPDEEDRRLAGVYYIPGEDGTREHRTWEPKEQAIMTGQSGSLELVEEELNLWANHYYDDAETEAGPVEIRAGTPNFRIDGDLQAKTDLEWSVFGVQQDFISIAQGEFVERRGEYRFRPSRVYIGSCPVPNVFNLARMTFNRVAGAYEVSEELREGWANLESVEIEERELKLVIP